MHWETLEAALLRLWATTSTGCLLSTRKGKFDRAQRVVVAAAAGLLLRLVVGVNHLYAAAHAGFEVFNC